jgi:hypothetical protein
MKKKFVVLCKIQFLFACWLCSAIAMQAQVTVGADTAPKATLEVVGKATEAGVVDGVIMPRLTGNQLKLKDNAYTSAHQGTVVYVTAAVTTASTKTAKVTAEGYYYFDGNVWQSMKGATTTAEKKWFYCPSAVLPTLASDPGAPYGSYDTGTQTFSFDTYKWYIDNMNLLNIPYASSTSRQDAMVSVYLSSNLVYLVTYYDSSVFSNVSISASGILTYKVIAGATPTAKTYMNIVFREK